MTGTPDHLTDDAGAVLAESVDERIYFIRSKRWIFLWLARVTDTYDGAAMRFVRRIAESAARSAPRRSKPSGHCLTVRE